MGTPKDWPHSIDMGDWMRQQEKRTMREERRPHVTKASDIMGPGIAPRAVVITDWNSETARSFNGFFYSAIGADNSPDDTKAWLGLTLSTGDHIQQVAWSHGVGVVEGFVRTGHEHNASAEFSAWEPMQADIPDAALYLNDLLDVDTAGVDDEDILKYEATSSEWVPRSFAHTHSGADVSTVAPTTNPVPRVIVGPGAAIVTWDSKASEVYDVYVAESNASGPTGADLHTSFEGVRPPVWVRSTPDGTALTTTDSYYFAVQARNAGGDGPALTADDWVEGRAGNIDPQYLVLNADIAGINELFAEVLQAVDVTVSGDFIANTLTAVGKATFASNDNELSPGAVLKLKKGITAPGTPLAVVQDWDYSTFGSIEEPMSGDFFSGLWYYSTGSTGAIKTFDPATGAIGSLGSISGFALDVVRVGSTWWVSQWVSSTWNMKVYNSTFTTNTATYSGIGGSTTTRITSDGTFVYTLDFISGHGRLRTFNLSGVQQGLDVNLTGQVTGTTFYAAECTTIGGTTRVIGLTDTGLFVLSTAGVRQATEEWDLPGLASSMRSVLWDGTNFRTFDRVERRLYVHTDDYWTDTNSKRWVTPTWTDATHETDGGTSYGYISLKRARTKITMSAPFPTGITGWKAYMGRNGVGATTPPTRANMWSVGSSATTPDTITLTSAPVFAGPSTHWPVSNEFLSTGTPSEIQSDDGTYSIDANFDALLNSLSLSSAGLIALRSALVHPEWSVKLHRAATISMTDSTDTLISWDDEMDDPGGMHAGVTAAITIPTGAAGYYDLSLSAMFAANATGRRTLVINKNSAAIPVVNGIELTRNANATASSTSIGGFWPSIPLVAGDVLRAWVWQNSGGALNLNEAYFTARWVKP